MDGTYDFEPLLLERLTHYQSGTRVIHSAPCGVLPEPTPPIFGDSHPQALIHVALLDGNTLVGALVVSMEAASRDWTADDVSLTESVASIARSAVDLDRLRIREHSLRSSFLSALLPRHAKVIPGLETSIIYRPADAEAGVGGDFYDVFPIDSDRTALVVGDVSGRGMAAAFQVAALRNMLRFALCQRGSLVDAVRLVNSVVVKNEILTDFATMFVAVYDATDKTLTYVCCGQEPALLRRRSSDQVVLLMPTAPVVGIDEDLPFEERTVELESGDLLLVYTDGLTDVGLPACQLSSVSRLIQTLRHCRPPFSAQGSLDSVMVGVIDYAKQGCRSANNEILVEQACEFKDDVCVMAIVFTE
jgi:hypothetical protein